MKKAHKKTTALVFVEELPGRRRDPFYDNLIEALAARPGEWAQVTDLGGKNARAVYQSLRNRGVTAQVRNYGTEVYAKFEE